MNEKSFWNYNLWQYLFELNGIDEKNMTASQKSHLTFLLSSLGYCAK